MRRYEKSTRKVVIYVLFGKDSAGRQYFENGNDRSAYEAYINRLEKEKKAGNPITVDPSTAADLERYQPGIFGNCGRLGGGLF